MDRLAFLGDNKEITIVQAGVQQQLTYALDEVASPNLWPTWSKDGRWVAYFQPLQEQAPARLCIAEVEGVQVRVLAEFQDRMPIYLHWSPTGDHIAVVEQSPEGLELVVYPTNGDRPIPLDEGAPIFFEWLQDGTGLVAHVIHPVRQTSRVQLYSLVEDREDEVLSEISGGFCAPQFWNGGLLFAEQKDGITHVRLMNLESRETETLCALKGVLSLQPRPHHPQLAIGVSGSNPNSKGVYLFDLQTQQLQMISVEQEGLVWQAMFWTPDGEKLLLSAINGAHRWMEWQVWTEEAGQQVIGQFLPTREQLFFLHFFDQFTLSHSIISEDNQHFYFSGYSTPHQRGNVQAKAVVYRGEIKPKGQFEEVDMGLFPTLQRASQSKSAASEGV